MRPVYNITLLILILTWLSSCSPPLSYMQYRSKMLKSQAWFTRVKQEQAQHPPVHTCEARARATPPGSHAWNREASARTRKRKNFLFLILVLALALASHVWTRLQGALPKYRHKRGLTFRAKAVKALSSERKYSTLLTHSTRDLHNVRLWSQVQVHEDWWMNAAWELSQSQTDLSNSFSDLSTTSTTTCVYKGCSSVLTISYLREFSPSISILSSEFSSFVCLKRERLINILRWKPT